MPKRIMVEVNDMPEDQSQLAIFLESEDGTPIRGEEAIDAIIEALTVHFDLDITPPRDQYDS